MPGVTVPDPPPAATPLPPGPRQQRVAVYGICLDAAGEPDGTSVLLVRAAPHLTVAGQWFLPGGGLDHGEDPVDGLRREFLEETGLEIAPGPLLGVISDVFTLPDADRTSLHSLRIVYGVEGYSGVLRDEVGGSSDTARWVPLDEALDLPLRPYVRKALTELRP
jgi:8-oxo-dGTP pyrophosphatase MutT (NUDIX family)